MEILSLAEQRQNLFRDRADELLKLAAGHCTTKSQALYLCMAHGYREMARQAQSRLH